MMASPMRLAAASKSSIDAVETIVNKEVAEQPRERG